MTIIIWLLDNFLSFVFRYIFNWIDNRFFRRLNGRFFNGLFNRFFNRFLNRFLNGLFNRFFNGFLNRFFFLLSLNIFLNDWMNRNINRINFFFNIKTLHLIFQKLFNYKDILLTFLITQLMNI